MTDRELLELAAKAAGMDYLVWTPGVSPLVPGEKRINGQMVWNPIHDDGDALRLAVRLDIEIEPVRFGGRAIVRDDDDYGEQFDEESSDRMAATRRAIARAAAEIGKRTTAREGER